MDHTAPNRSHSALLTIDVRNDFVLPGAPAVIPGAFEVVPAIRDLVHAFRKSEIPIVHVVRVYKPDGSNVGCVDGSFSIKEMASIGVHLMTAAECRKWCSTTEP